MTPSPASQLEFLSKLQRLLAEGSFSATYKYALLISLADLAVKVGADDGDELELSMRDIASEFIEMYWQQAAPYSGHGVESGVLLQNYGSQAAVITQIAEFRQAHPSGTVRSAQLLDDYGTLIQGVAKTVAAQPVKYLQNFEGATDAFLYERVRGGIRLKPGVVYCLRRFQPLIQQVARSQWIQHVKRNRQNYPILGAGDDLASFMFETPRQALGVIAEALRQVTGDKCFYCDRTVEVDTVDVDHFIPFTLYPRDFLHNFVLADAACNRSKSDTLSAQKHLEKWLAYSRRYDDVFQDIGKSVGKAADLMASRSVAQWGYKNGVRSGARAWCRPGAYEKITTEYLQLPGWDE